MPGWCTTRPESGRVVPMDNTNTHTQPDEQLFVLTVPALFFEDHCERDCVDGEYDTPYGIIKKTQTRWTVALNEDDVLELLDDAFDKADPGWVRDDVEHRGRTNSAKATIKAVALQMTAMGYQFDEDQIRKYGLREFVTGTEVAR